MVIIACPSGPPVSRLVTSPKRGGGAPCARAGRGAPRISAASATLTNVVCIGRMTAREARLERLELVERLPARIADVDRLARRRAELALERGVVRAASRAHRRGPALRD